MNYIKQLNAFTKKMAYDPMMNPNHLALYQALFQQWNYMRFPPVFAIRRETTLQLSKIGSAKTYYKCLKALQAGGYIKYYPAAGKYALAKISMVVLHENETEKQPTIFCTNGHEELGLSLVPEGELAETTAWKEDTAAIITHQYTQKATRSVKNIPHGCSEYDTPRVKNIPRVCSEYDTLSVKNIAHGCSEYDTLPVKNIPRGSSEYTTLPVQNIPQGDSKNDPDCEALLPHSLIKQKKNKVIKSESVNVFPNWPSPTDNNSIFLNQEKMQQQPPAPVEHFYPTLEEAITYFKKYLHAEQLAKKFHYHYNKEGWRLAGDKPINNWKGVAQKWMLYKNDLPENIKRSLWNFDASLYTGEDENHTNPL